MVSKWNVEILTSNACKKLPRETLDLTIREWDKGVALEEVEDALSE
jgi:hypothetical protein